MLAGNRVFLYSDNFKADDFKNSKVTQCVELNARGPKLKSEQMLGWVFRAKIGLHNISVELHSYNYYDALNDINIGESRIKYAIDKKMRLVVLFNTDIGEIEGNRILFNDFDDLESYVKSLNLDLSNDKESADAFIKACLLQDCVTAFCNKHKSMLF